MIPVGFDFTKVKKPIRKGYKCKDETFTKYGKEISIKDYVQEGKNGTEIKEIIKQAGGLEHIQQKVNNDMPDANITIDLNMDPYIANRLVKMGKIAQDKVNKRREEAEKLAQMQQQQKQNQNKGGEE